jgi:hypothetical protein
MDSDGLRKSATEAVSRAADDLIVHTHTVRALAVVRTYNHGTPVRRSQ